MSFFQIARDIITAGERTVKEPIFLKDFSNDNQQIDELLKLSEQLFDGDKKRRIDRDIAYLKKGLQGEANVYYELKNSLLPILCLHDIRFKHGDYIAQMDFVVISNKFLCVLETKQLFGNIMVNSNDDFIRIITDKNGREVKREGMYNPIAQNERHLNILKNAMASEGMGKTMPSFSFVVLANPKTIVDKKQCSDKAKTAIIRHDQLSFVLRELQNDKKNEKNLLEKYMYDYAKFILDHDSSIKYDYESKYGLTADDFMTRDILRNSPRSQVQPTGAQNKQDLTAKLKEYRLAVSKAENIAAYMVFTNQEMEDLIIRNPQTKQELLEIKGFGKKKVEKYGQAILNVFRYNL